MNKYYLTLVAFLLLIASFGKGAAESINWEVVSGGGGVSGSDGHFLIGTVGQTAVGMITSANYGQNQGYVQDFSMFFSCNCVPGEVIDDNNINLLDILYLISYKYREGPPPYPYAV